MDHALSVYRLKRRLAWACLAVLASLWIAGAASAQTETPTPTPAPTVTPTPAPASVAAEQMTDYLTAWALTLVPYVTLAAAFGFAARVFGLTRRLFLLALAGGAVWLGLVAEPRAVHAQPEIITIDGEDWYVLLDQDYSIAPATYITVTAPSYVVVRYVARCWTDDNDGDTRARTVDNVSGDGWNNCRQVTSFPPPAPDNLSYTYQLGGTWAQFYNTFAVYDLNNYHSSASTTVRLQVLGLVPEPTPTPTPTPTPAPSATPTPTPGGIYAPTRNPCITAVSGGSGLAYTNYVSGPNRNVTLGFFVPADRASSGVLYVEAFGSQPNWSVAVGSGLYPGGPLTYLWPLESEVPSQFAPGKVARYVPYMLTEGGNRRIWLTFTAASGWDTYTYRVSVQYVGAGGCLRSPTPRPSRPAPTLAATVPVVYATEIVSFGRTPLPTLCPIYIESWALATPTGTPAPDYWQVCIEPERVDSLRVGNYDMLPTFSYLLLFASVSAVIVAVRSTRSS